MKIVNVVAIAVVAAMGMAGGLPAQTTPTQTPPAGKSAPAPTAGNATATKASAATKTAPAAAGAASAAKAPAKKAEAPAKIEGMEIARGTKGFLGLQLVGGTFKLSFYDMKKKPVAPDVVRAVLRWDPKGKVGQERFVLNREGMALSSPRTVKPPHAFKLYITLIKEDAAGGATGDGADAAAAGETIVVDFKG